MPLLGSARRSAGLLVAASVVVVDQATKVAATHDPSRTVMPEHNPAYALGVVTGPAPVLIIVSVVVLCAFVVMVDGWASRLRISVVLPALVAGGIVGNLHRPDPVRLGARLPRDAVGDHQLRRSRDRDRSGRDPDHARRARAATARVVAFGQRRLIRTGLPAA